MRKPYGYWTEKKVAVELETISKELGHFPVDGELRSMGKHGLREAIERHGGISKFDSKKKPRNGWTEEGVITELETLIVNLGYLPTGTQLKKLKRGDLLNAINKYGGYIKFRIILSNKLEN